MSPKFEVEVPAGSEKEFLNALRGVEGARVRQVVTSEPADQAGIAEYLNNYKLVLARLNRSTMTREGQYLANKGYQELFSAVKTWVNEDIHRDPAEFEAWVSRAFAQCLTVKSSQIKQEGSHLTGWPADIITPREAKVVIEHFSLDGWRKRTLEEIGREDGVSGERVRQIERKALIKFRRSFRIHVQNEARAKEFQYKK